MIKTKDISLCLNCDKKKIAENFFKKAGINRKYKLVRDKFPDLVKKAGEKREFSKCSQKEYIQILKEKILEEAIELYLAQGECNESDLADIQELIYAIIKEFNISKAKLDNIRQGKVKEKGKYTKGFLMKL